MTEPRQPPLLASLTGAILARAREAGYLPPDELPFFPELESSGQAIVTGVCQAISGRMEAGMPHEDLARVFADVVRRSFDAVWRWYRSEDGVVEPPAVTGDPVAGEYRGELPAGVADALRDLPAGAVLYDAFARWLDANLARVREEKLDLWAPVGAALQATFLVAAAMAYAVFEEEAEG